MAERIAGCRTWKSILKCIFPLWRPWVLLLCMLGAGVTGCTNARSAEIGDLESEREALTPRVAALETALGNLTSQYQHYQDSMRQLEIKTEAYMNNHKMAVAALVATVGGGSVALDAENSFTKEARAVAAGITVGAVVWLANNMDEAIEVADTLTQADSQMKELQRAASQVEAQWQQASAEIGPLRARLAAINRRLAELRNQ